MAHLSAYLYALAVGLVIGLERERSNARPAQAYGIRTFALLALVGALAAEAGAAAVAVSLVGVVALLVVGYRRTNASDPGTTTEVAAMATFLLGVLCRHDAALAAAIALVVVALLMSKARLHRFVSEILSDVELEDALKFLIGAFVVLPLLPRRDVGPYGVINPSHIWLIVVLMTGISWAGYIAVRVLGARRGRLAAGLAAGFVSATATTAATARSARRGEALVLNVGAAQAASVATYVELAIILSVVSAPVGLRVIPACLLGVGTLVVAAVRAVRRWEPEASDSSHPSDRVISFLPAITLAVILTLTLLVARWASVALGARGVLLAVAAAGLADAHGGAISAATLYAHGDLGLTACLLAVGAALTTNTVVKALVAGLIGRGRFARPVVTGLAASLTVFLGALALTLVVTL